MARSRPCKASALLLIDFFNPTNFDGVRHLAQPALRAASRTARLKTCLRRAGIPAIYANDNFGHWESEFAQLVKSCHRSAGPAGEIARMLSPQRGDRALLKPRHSAFYGTALDFLLQELGCRLLILTGTSTDSCISVTAHDAHMRKFELWIPSDCVASEESRYTNAALVQLRRVTNASTAPSTRADVTHG